MALSVRVHRADDEREAPARELLTVILGEDLIAREAALRRGRRLQAFPRRRAVVVVLEPFGAPLSRAGMERLARHLDLPLHAEDDRATMLVHEGSIVLLVSADLSLDRLLRALRRRAALPLSVGTSRVVDDSRSYPGAYRQAQRAATLGRRLGRANQVTDYDQLGVLRLLYQLPEHERRAFAQEVLGPLITAGADPDAANMLGVLHALRSAHGNITEAARRLFIHPNTLRQRIARIESLIGPFLADADRRLTVFVALDLHLLDHDETR
jgi:DNA-binding PucR family transcriptional regulator